LAGWDDPAERTMNLAQQTSRRFALLLAAFLAVSLFSVIYPIYVIRPFRPQGARELAAALVVTRYRPAVALICALAAMATLAWYWRRLPGKWWRVLALVGAGFAAALALVARVNIFELMFHPLEHPAFAAATDVKVDKDDKLIVVKIGGSARAYPIRTMGYHHVVNDVVGGTALVATY
jgi:hypothetical protein